MSIEEEEENAGKNHAHVLHSHVNAIEHNEQYV
ncbi:Ferric reduction oxidase 5 [Senna tora]|uniref:Ferric reduction oxidase 5 n=1 Tax=Senna tora TaxID=362788 RepID=A0A834SZS5_9FABA|nr:Ferric reduction oxidase 5 [Senna tora]